MPGMLGAARRADGIRYVRGDATRLPFADAAFDGLTFTYLLRYVEDPAATLRELARVVRPGGRVASLELNRPRAWPLRLVWWLYTRAALPALGGLVSRDWRDVGAFLGGSVDRFYDRWPQREIERLWRAAGFAHVRSEVLGFGAAVVTSGLRDGVGAPDSSGGAAASRAGGAGAADRPAFYALASGGWRDYLTLLHPPYTLWHLSYVVLGAALAPAVRLDRLAGALVAFFLALGIGVHALDELNGRPLRTGIPAPALVALGAGGIAGAVALGLAAAPLVGPGLLAFVAAGAILALGYPLELARGRLHSDLWFAVGWGAFPVLAGCFASAGTLSAAAVGGAAYAFALSYAQRRLSTWVRMLRRRAVRIDGEIETADGARTAVGLGLLVAPAESALRWLTAASVLVGLAALAARVLGPGL